MTRCKHVWRGSARSAAMLALLCAPAAAQAQSSGSDSATVKLIQLLIQKGILTQGQAASLLSQAQAEAGGSAATAPARHGRHATRGTATASAPPPPAPIEAAAAAPPGEVRVTYVPQFVRDQIAAQVRTQVLSQVQAQGWAAPNALPEWTKRITLYGDLRLRYQDSIQSKSNIDAKTGLPFPFTDFNAINAGSGFDTSNLTTTLPPLINVNENRSRYRVRARIGVRAQIADWVSSDIRLATGNDNSPVSENQTLGSPGDFSKYAIYIDRAYLNFTPLPGLKILAGRTPNPYFVSDLMYAPDLNFDGVDAQYTLPVTSDLSVFVVGGAHPVFNTSLNFSSQQITKTGSHDAYLLAGQAGAVWRVAQDYVAKIGAGYFGYSNITGKESAPCLLFSSADTCSSDDTRPSFLQFGNTVFPIRNIVTNPSYAPQPQYYGLASHFGIIDVHGRIDAHNFDPVTVSLEGEFIKNLAYNRSYILARTPSNNYGGSADPSNPNALGPYQGGDTGYMAKLTVGHLEIDKLWDWNASFAYKYLESDAAVDAFTDPDFHLGGTNARGYVVGVNLGIAANTYLSARWLSANQISGPPDGNDVLQVDLNAKF